MTRVCLTVVCSRAEVWQVIESMNIRLKKVNTASFLSQNVVRAITQHLVAIRLTNHK